MPYRDMDTTQADQTTIQRESDREETPQRRKLHNPILIGMNGAAGESADTLSRNTNGRLTRAGQDLIQMQSRYGNHYVQRFINPQKSPSIVAKRNGKQGDTLSLQSRNSLLLQTKLTVGAVGDKYEQEADRVAAQVVQALGQPNASQSVQRQTEAEGIQLKSTPKPCQPVMVDNLILRDHSAPQRQAGADGGIVSEHIESSIQRTRGRGKPLDSSVRTSMEQVFGADFSNVKIHTDSTADSLNRSLSARAFTTGSDLYFRKGEYNPISSGGRELLAHELTHVVQQGGAGLQKKTAENASVQIQEHGGLTIQRLISGAELKDVDPVHKRSKRYLKIIELLDEYRTLAEKTDIKSVNHPFMLSSHSLLYQITNLAEDKKGSRPILGILIEDIINEKARIKGVFLGKYQFGKEGSVYKIIGQKTRTADEYKSLADTFDLKSGPRKTLARFANKIGGKALSGLTALALVLEGIGHLTYTAIATVAGVAAAGMMNILTAIGLFVAAFGNLVVGCLKFVRAVMVKWKDRLTDKLKSLQENAANNDSVKALKARVVGLDKTLGIFVSIEGGVKFIADLISIILIPKPWAFATIGSLIRQAIKFFRGFVMNTKFKKGSKKKGVTSVMTIVEALFGLFDNIENAAPPKFEDNFVDEKSGMRWLGDVGSSVKTARGSVGGVGGIKAKVTEAEDANKEEFKKYKQDYDFKQYEVDYESEVP